MHFPLLLFGSTFRFFGFIAFYTFRHFCLLTKWKRIKVCFLHVGQQNINDFSISFPMWCSQHIGRKFMFYKLYQNVNQKHMRKVVLPACLGIAIVWMNSWKCNWNTSLVSNGCNKILLVHLLEPQNKKILVAVDFNLVHVLPQVSVFSVDKVMLYADKMCDCFLFQW